MSGAARVRATAAALWVLVAMGPLLGAAALLRPPSATVPPPAGPPAPVVGVAELAVLAHVARGAEAAVPVRLQPALRALRTTDPLEGLGTAERTTALAAARRPVAGVGVVAARPAGPGRWGVTVGVLRGDALQAWQVTVAEVGGSAVVETVPAPVGVPAGGRAPTPALGVPRTPDPDDPLAAAVARFLQALLAGEGELQRYLAPGTAVAPLDPPAAAVQLRRIAAGPLAGDASGTGRVAVLAEVRTTAVDGGVALAQYPLLLRPAGGRWEVQQVLPALPAAPAATTTAHSTAHSTTSTTTPPDPGGAMHAQTREATP